MEKCANCGKKIPDHTEHGLCRRCARCGTLYEANLVRLRRGLLKSLRSAVVICAIAAVLRWLVTWKYGNIASTILFYYAVLQLCVGCAGFLSNYLQLRLKVKNELAEKGRRAPK